MHVSPFRLACAFLPINLIYLRGTLNTRRGIFFNFFNVYLVFLICFRVKWDVILCPMEQKLVNAKRIEPEWLSVQLVDGAPPPPLCSLICVFCAADQDGNNVIVTGSGTNQIGVYDLKGTVDPRTGFAQLKKQYRPVPAKTPRASE